MTDDFMSGGGAKGVPFDNPGDTVTGVVVAPPELRTQMDDKGQPKRFDSGDIRTMWVVRISTTLRDPSDPFDNGDRNLYLKWKSFEAVRQAVLAAGAPTLEVGGTLTLTLAGFGQKDPNKKLFNPPKLWSARYVPAPPQTAPDGFMGQPQGYPPQQQYAPPPQQYAPQPQYYQPQQYTQQVPVPAPMPAPAPMPPPAPVSPAADTRSLLERMAGQHQANPYTNPPVAPDQDNSPF